MTGRRERPNPAVSLIGQVYDAALDEGLWAGLAPDVAKICGSTSAVVTTRNLSTGHMRVYALTGNFEPALVEAYFAHYHQIDLWAERAARFAMGKVVASREIVSDGDLERTEFYENWVRKLGIFYAVGSVFPVADDEIGILGIHRPRSCGTYDDHDKRLVSQFLPHLQRALQIQRRLSDVGIERQLALDALERSRIATLVVARNGRILFSNGRADALLRQGDAIRVTGGRLVAAERSSTERLTRLIHGAIDATAERGGAPGGVLPIPRTNRLPLTLLVAPLRPARHAFGAPAPTALLLIGDSEAQAPCSLALQGLFGLTPTEATISTALADGKSIEDIAAIRGISLNTARTHLKNVFSKTGTNRQAQLVTLILRSVALVTPSRSS